MILMNHSCFLDLKIASGIFFPKPFSIVSTTDGFVGKSLLMRMIGCIPTKKYVSDVALVRDMRYALTKCNSNVLMFPEAGYSLDGRASSLPESMGAVLKWLKAPVVALTTYGAFARDPLYNGLQLRKVKVHAKVKCLLSSEEVQNKPIEEIDRAIRDAFSFDQFRWQKENGVKITEPFRADGLERLLYKCAACRSEGSLKGEGTHLTCVHCGKKYELTEYGEMRALNGDTEYAHIPDWYDWQREEVRNEVLSGQYRLEKDVEIGMLVDYKALYMIGSGVLTHDQAGFTLTGADGREYFRQLPYSAHSLNVDYFWYEKGDVICIGNSDALFYCFPKGDCSVTKARLAAEAIYASRRRKKG